MFYPPSTQFLAQVKAGKLRAIGTEYRIPALPEVPTFEEAGLRDFEVPGWVGLVAPAKTPRDIVMRLNKDAIRVMGTAELAKAMEGLSMAPIPGSPEDFAKKIADDMALWGPIIKSAGVKQE